MRELPIFNASGIMKGANVTAWLLELGQRIVVNSRKRASQKQRSRLYDTALWPCRCATCEGKS